MLIAISCAALASDPAGLFVSVGSDPSSTASLISPSREPQGSARPMSQLAARLTQPTEQLRTLLQRPISSDTLVTQAGGTPISTTKVWVPGTDTELTRDPEFELIERERGDFSLVCRAVHGVQCQ